MTIQIKPISGLWVPCLTPFDEQGAVDASRLTQLAGSLVGRGASGIVPFGSTGEANSLSVGEREQLLIALLESGISPERILPGTGACALPDAVRLSRNAVELNCRGILVLPPFYYKPLSDDALFRYYAELIEQVASERLRVYLYHIPALSGIAITEALIERLLGAYPLTIAGLKDSSRDWEHTRHLLEQFPDLTVVPGNAALLQASRRKGAPGCIAAIGNVVPDHLARLCDHWDSMDSTALQNSLTRFEDIIREYSPIAAMKQLIAQTDPAWRTVRPPLQSLPDAAARALTTEIDKVGLM